MITDHARHFFTAPPPYLRHRPRSIGYRFRDGFAALEPDREPATTTARRPRATALHREDFTRFALAAMRPADPAEALCGDYCRAATCQDALHRAGECRRNVGKRGPDKAPRRKRGDR